MDKRDFKKAVTTLGTSICVDMFNIGTSSKGMDSKVMNECMNDVWTAMVETRDKANNFFGKAQKEYESKEAYLAARRKFFVDLFKGLSTEFSEKIDAALTKFNAAIPKSN